MPMERLHVLPAGGALYGAYTDYTACALRERLRAWSHAPCMHDCMPLNTPPTGGAVYAERLLSLVTTPLGKPQPTTVSPCFSSLDCIPSPLLTRCSRTARRVRAQPRPVAFRPAAATADTARARGAAFPRRHGAEALALQRGRAGAGVAQ